MAKKKGGGGKKGGKKGKKGPVDWGAQQIERYVEVEVRNSAWQSLRFTQVLPTSTKLVRERHDHISRNDHHRAPRPVTHLSTHALSHYRHFSLLFSPLLTSAHPLLLWPPQGKIVDLIIERHQVSGVRGLNLYLGEAIDEISLLSPAEYGLSLADVKFPGGSLNDHVLQVVTYDYVPHKGGETEAAPGAMAARSYGVLNLPRGVRLPPLRSMGPC